MRRALTASVLLALLVPAPARAADTGGARPAPRATPVAPAPAAGPLPAPVALALAAGDALQAKPYRWGGGHGRWDDSAYDCSGAVSYVLHAAGLLDAALDSGGLARWGDPGPGRYVTIYANRGHAFMVIAGRRLDTQGGKGPRWQLRPRAPRGFVARHPPGL